MRAGPWPTLVLLFHENVKVGTWKASPPPHHTHTHTHGHAHQFELHLILSAGICCERGANNVKDQKTYGSLLRPLTALRMRGREGELGI